MSPEDRDYAIRTMLAEAGEGADEAALGAVGEVILNRAQAGRYGGRTIRDVVLAKNQFEPWNKGSGNDPRRFNPESPSYKRAAFVFDAIQSGKLPSLTKGATHFYAPKAQAQLGRSTPKWASPGSQTTPVNIGGHAFYAPEGKVNFDPSSFDALSRSQTPTQIQPPKPVSGMLPTPGAATTPQPMAPAAPKSPTGNMLGRLFGGDASRTPQSWADVFAGAGPGNPLLFRALSYGMQPSPGSGGPAANAGGGQMSATLPAPQPAASTSPPMSLPSAGPQGEAVGGNSSPGMPGLLGMLQKAFGGGSTPAPAMPLAGAAPASNPLGGLASLFKMI